MVDVGCIAKDAESRPDKESAERMSQGGRNGGRHCLRQRRLWRGIQRSDPAEKIVDTGFNTDEVESQPDKKSVERMRQSGRMLVITV
jgi:hypothetical protein